MFNGIKRTDLCPCNSGKEFKNCHMRTFEPQEKFTVKVSDGNIAPAYHLVSPDGVNWVKKPGRIPIRVSYLSKKYPEIDELLKPLFDNIPETELLHSRIFRLQHKLAGLGYYIENFENRENQIIDDFNTQCKGSDHDSIVIDPDLTYGLESILFQMKSTLDIVSQMIGISFRLPYVHTYANEGKELVTILQNNCPKQLKQEGERLSTIIQENMTWVSDMVDMRDDVTHISDLQGFSCFIQHAWLGGDTTDISFPSMPDGKRTQTYLRSNFQNIMNLIKQIIPFLIIGIKNKQKISNNVL